MASDKIVVITGCSSGIGLETAVILAKEKGYKVIATMRNLKKKDVLEKAAADTLNKSMIIKELDISKEDSIVGFVKNTIKEEGRIDVLINNAAVGQFGKFESVSMEQMQNLFQTNVFGTARITQEVLPDMKKRKSGQIIFISSVAGVKPFPFMDFYIASKFAIEGLVGNLAPLLHHFNIRISYKSTYLPYSVTSVQPGPVKTPFATNISDNKQGSFVPTSETDETEALIAPFMKTFGQEFMSHIQDGEEVAQLIKKCIIDNNPPVVVQTSEAITEMVAKILVDPTGNKLRDELGAYFK
ncbi:Retinol dehydrogenase 8 [Holothuria leucospilota]|uniref:Retinol dehydrogenase 8 n=1 Tax=Holothuria leucospilota TaxID=206669 RepID=A0A9Q1H625_HOLLE|nr:Retinol dehydrogenase 8 [Holothuria leucospilota]